jgi:hypothetical protein
MTRLTVLFFAADPYSNTGDVPRLLLDEDVRAIRAKVRSSEFRDRLVFDVRWAARPDDLIQAFNETPPHVVHFSGHGRSEGLVLVGDDGRPRIVSVDALVHLFGIFGRGVRVVVLSACYSYAQAAAIARTVECVIGTRGPLYDQAAITFNASFYRGIAFGRSVGESFEQAKLALLLEHPDAACPELLARDGVDPAKMVLVPMSEPEARHFTNVGYSDRSFGIFHFRDHDVGTLTIRGRQAEFRGEKGTVRIEHVREVTHGRQGGDVFANWVKVRHDTANTTSVAYFSRQTMAANLLGGSDDLFAALHAMIETAGGMPGRGNGS